MLRYSDMWFRTQSCVGGRWREFDLRCYPLVSPSRNFAQLQRLWRRCRCLVSWFSLYTILFLLYYNSLSFMFTHTNRTQGSRLYSRRASTAKSLVSRRWLHEPVETDSQSGGHTSTYRPWLYYRRTRQKVYVRTAPKSTDTYAECCTSMSRRSWFAWYDATSPHISASKTHYCPGGIGASFLSCQPCTRIWSYCTIYFRRRLWIWVRGPWFVR